MVNKDRQKNEFQERLKRIHAGGPNTLGQVYVGVTEDRASQRAAQKIMKKRNSTISIRSILLFPFSFSGAFIIGMIAVLMSRFIRVQFYGSGLAGSDADILMLMDGSLALALAYVLRWMFRFQGKGLQIAATVGVALMMVSMHNLIHLAPEVFELAYPAEWVQEVIYTTRLDSLLFRGVSIHG